MADGGICNERGFTKLDRHASVAAARGHDAPAAAPEPTVVATQVFERSVTRKRVYDIAAARPGEWKGRLDDVDAVVSALDPMSVGKDWTYPSYRFLGNIRSHLYSEGLSLNIFTADFKKSMGHLPTQNTTKTDCCNSSS